MQVDREREAAEAPEQAIGQGGRNRENVWLLGRWDPRLGEATKADEFTLDATMP